MTPSVYQQQCKKFDNHAEGHAALAAVLGLAAEAGEVANEYERSLRSPSPGGFSSLKVALELGDVMWNAARLASELDYSLEEIMQMNIDKLTARYIDRGLALQGEA